MPDLLDREARAVFSRHVSDLGPSEFRAVDGSKETIPSEYYDKASGMWVLFGDDTDHQLFVDLAHSPSEAEGAAQEYCDEGLAEGYFLECTVDISDAGTVISWLGALRPPGDERNFSDGTMIAVKKDRLGVVDPDSIWFEHNVKVIKSETFVTYVSERVHAPTREQAEALFEVPVADLAELGLDPDVVIPHPQADPGGCPQWMLPSTDATCGEVPPASK